MENEFIQGLMSKFEHSSGAMADGHPLLQVDLDERMYYEIKWSTLLFLERPDVFAEFGRVSVFYVSERCGVVSVSSFKVVFCESNVCFSSVVVLACDGGLVDN